MQGGSRSSMAVDNPRGTPTYVTRTVPADPPQSVPRCLIEPKQAWESRPLSPAKASLCNHLSSSADTRTLRHPTSLHPSAKLPYV